MKHKILFILPRLAGLTVLVGLASLVLFLLFKLLVLAVVIGVIVTIAAKIISKARGKWMANAALPFHGNTPFGQLHHSGTLQPVAGSKVQTTPAIIPIH